MIPTMALKIVPNPTDNESANQTAIKNLMAREVLRRRASA
jgi:hypothetical protein